MKTLNIITRVLIVTLVLGITSTMSRAETPDFKMTPQLIEFLKNNPNLWRKLGQISLGAGNNTPELTLLSLFWSSDKHDNHTVFNANPPDRSLGERTARQQGYRYVRVEGCPLKANLPGTKPIRLYYHSKRGDYASVVEKDGYVALENGGYEFVRNQGYVYTSQQPGTIPLQQYYNNDHQDAFLTGNADSMRTARNSGYRFLRTEGWVYPDVVGGCVFY